MAVATASGDALTYEELPIESAAAALEVVRAALRARVEAQAPQHRALALRLAAVFVERLDRCGILLLEGVTPDLAPVSVRVLHQEFLEQLRRYFEAIARSSAAPPKRSGRPSDKSSRAEEALCAVLGALPISPAVRFRIVAQVLVDFFADDDVRLTGTQVDRRAAARAARFRQRIRAWQAEGANPRDYPRGFLGVLRDPRGPQARGRRAAKPNNPS